MKTKLANRRHDRLLNTVTIIVVIIGCLMAVALLTLACIGFATLLTRTI